MTHALDEGEPRLLDILIDGLDSWFREVPLEDNAYPPSYRPLIRQQNEIGWRHLFNGHVSTQWRILQDRYVC